MYPYPVRPSAESAMLSCMLHFKFDVLLLELHNSSLFDQWKVELLITMSVLSCGNLPVISQPAGPIRLLVGCAGHSNSLRTPPTRAQAASSAATRRQVLAGSAVVLVASRRSAMAAAGGPLYEAWVKGDPQKKVLGDCEYGQLCIKFVCMSFFLS